MATNQYHEPVEELSPELRRMTRLLLSCQEELEAIDWYGQRMHVEKDAEFLPILRNAQKEEMKHFSMFLEKIFRENKLFKSIAKEILFKDGDIVENGEKAEEID